MDSKFYLVGEGEGEGGQWGLLIVPGKVAGGAGGH